MKPMTILSIFVCLLSVLSCGSDNEETEVAVIDVSPAQLSATHEGLVTSATINSGLEWTAFSDDACKDWISCKITDNGSQGTVEVTVKANTTYQSREGKVVVKAGAARTSIPVTQAARPEPSADPDITVPEGYRLVWNEEFNKGTQPDLDQWYYETGENGWGNNELQHYVAGNQGNEQLAAIKDGILSIIAKKIGETVYSIRMNTKESWKYGYFEARLKLPKGKGTWPAFWMMPKNYTAWPDDGEIDIMEEVGYNANYVSSAIHCKAYHHSIGTQKTGETFLPTAQTEFHVYGSHFPPGCTCRAGRYRRKNSPDCTSSQNRAPKDVRGILRNSASRFPSGRTCCATLPPCSHGAPSAEHECSWSSSRSPRILRHPFRLRRTV